MREEKLNKYRQGKFILKEKHIFAKNNLEIIRNHLLSKYNLVGGSERVQNKDSSVPKKVWEKINSYSDFAEVNEFVERDGTPNNDTIEDLITKGMGEVGELLVKNDDPVFKDLMVADKNLVEEFSKYKDLASENYTGLKDKDKVKAELLKIQKSLFNLQVKIIFSKLRSIKNVDITPLLSVINKKIEAMNNYIEEQERLFEVGGDKEGNNDVKRNINQNKTPIINQNETQIKQDTTLTPNAPETTQVTTPETPKKSDKIFDDNEKSFVEDAYININNPLDGNAEVTNDEIQEIEKALESNPNILKKFKNKISEIKREKGKVIVNDLTDMY